MRLKKLAFVFSLFAVFVFSLALALTRGGVIIDGTTYPVRVINNGGEPYVSARDMAKALGKKFQVHNGTLVFGAPGGKNSAAATVIEYGKWGFNGVIRMRVTNFNPADKGCPNNQASVTYELSNATNGNITFAGTGSLTGNTHALWASFSKGGVFLGNQPGFKGGTNWLPQNIPPAQHVAATWCVNFAGAPDLMTVWTGKNDGWGNYKPLGTTMKFKLNL